MGKSISVLTYLLSPYVYHLYLYLPSGKLITPWQPYQQRASYTLYLPSPFCLAHVKTRYVNCLATFWIITGFYSYLDYPFLGTVSEDVPGHRGDPITTGYDEYPFLLGPLWRSGCVLLVRSELRLGSLSYSVS